MAVSAKASPGDSLHTMSLYTSLGTDSPRSTLNQVLVSDTTWTEQGIQGKCRIYNLNANGYAPMGKFRVLSKPEEVLKFVFSGDVLTCPPPGRTPVNFTTTYEFRNGDLYRTQFIQADQGSCRH